jgi:2Fe-2S ferredoxin
VDEAQAGLVPPPTEDEIELLSNVTTPRRSNSRLSCQIKIPSSIDELIVFVPESQS